jgi:hypothetical protein
MTLRRNSGLRNAFAAKFNERFGFCFFAITAISYRPMTGRALVMAADEMQPSDLPAPWTIKHVAWG